MYGRFIAGSCFFDIGDKVVTSCVLHVVGEVLSVEPCMLHGVCCMPYVVCCMLRVVCCTLKLVCGSSCLDFFNCLLPAMCFV